jgi:hypothetical protein
MNGRRCSLVEAIIELLAPDFTPRAAAARITQAINETEDDQFPLYCNNVLVNHGGLNVVLDRKEDGSWIADIESIGPGLGWARWAHNWELEVDVVLALKPQPDTRVESAQAMAITAQQTAEAATAETASVRAALQAELEKALARIEELRTALQTVTEPREKTEAASTTTNNPRRRRPSGPKPARNWQEHVMRKVIHAYSKGRPIPSGPDLAQSCLDDLDLEVDVSAINKLLREL